MRRCGRRYEEGPADRTSEDRILEPLLNAGYVQAKLIERIPTPGAVENGTVPVVLTAKLQAGEVYKVASVSFAGTPLLSAEAFAATAKLHGGEVASREELLETLAPLDAAYRRKGYMDVVVEAVPSFDAAAHTRGVCGQRGAGRAVLCARGNRGRVGSGGEGRL